MGWRQSRGWVLVGLGLAIALALFQSCGAPPLDADAGTAPPAVYAQAPTASELRWEGQRLVLERRCEEALDLLAQAVDLYQAENADPNTSDLQRDSNQISELIIYSHMAGCYAQQADYDNLLTTLRTSIQLRNELAQQPYLQEGAETGLTDLPNWLDTWRGRLPDDTARIQALDASGDFFNDLTWVLVELQNPDAALVASEKGRARAIADLLTVNQLERPSDRATLALASTLDKIRQTAQTHQITLVEYAFITATDADEDALYVWVVDPTGTVHFEPISLGSGGRAALQSTITASRNALGRRLRGGFVLADPQPEDQEMALRDLHYRLIAPIQRWLPQDETAAIALIPQDELFLVPFPALLDDADQPLIASHTLLTAPSIQVLELTYQRQTALPTADFATTTGALLVGNPTMPLNPVTDERLERLPGAETEVKAIADILDAAPLIAATASETLVKQRIGTAPLVHLATHGLLEYGTDESAQPPGAIALAPDDTNDGLLTASEILQLDLTAALVVLSACDTGLGNITGDGVVGLARSLFSAGTPSVVVSLWGVPDQPTADLMTAFYQAWRSGQLNKAQALRQAMLQTRQTHPGVQDWGAFTLIGAP